MSNAIEKAENTPVQTDGTAEETADVEEHAERCSLCAFEKDGRRFVVIDQEQDRFDGKDPSEYSRIARAIINERFVSKVVGIDNRVFVNGRGRDEYVHPSSKITHDMRNVKMHAAGELDNLIDAGTNFRNEPDGRDGHVHPDVIGGFDYFDTLFNVGNKYFEAVINIKNVNRGKLFKDVTKIKDVTKVIMNSYGETPKFQYLRTSSTVTVSDTSPKVNQSEISSQLTDRPSLVFQDTDAALDILDGMDINQLADLSADVFDLVEYSKFYRDSPDKKSHKNTDYFDYFLKTVQIDGKVFDVLVDVKKQYSDDDGYVYTIKLTENDTVKALPASSDRKSELVKMAGERPIGSKPQTPEPVKPEILSTPNTMLQKDETIQNSLVFPDTDAALDILDGIDVSKLSELSADAFKDVKTSGFLCSRISRGFLTRYRRTRTRATN